MPNQTRFSTFIRGQPRWRIGAVALILALGVLWLKGGAKSAANGATFAARRGPLDISVLDGGTFQVGSTWQPTPVSTLLTGLSELVGVKSIQIQITVSGNVQIDDLFVDPLLQEA